MAEERGPKWVSQWKVAGNIFTRRLFGTRYEELVATLGEKELLYALFDVLKTPEELAEDQRLIDALEPDDIGFGMTPSWIKTVCMRVDSQAEFDEHPWSKSGWVQFYAVPDWFAQSELLS